MSKLRNRAARWLILSLIFFVLVSAVVFFTFPPPGHITVLMYHFVVPKDQMGPTSLDVSVDEFRKQMMLLKWLGIQPISLDEYYHIKMGKTEPSGKKVVLTFDDGNITYLTHALPILVSLGFPSTNFVVWNNLIHHEEQGSMSLEDAKRIAGNPLVTLGSHTLSHANLTQLNPEQIEIEVKESKTKLEAALGKPVYYFSYPTGDFTGLAAETIQEAGYRLAFTTSPKHLGVTRVETLYSTVRYKIGSRDNLFIFWLKASGLAAYGKQLQFLIHRLTRKKPDDKLIEVT